MRVEIGLSLLEILFEVNCKMFIGLVTASVNYFYKYFDRSAED